MALQISRAATNPHRAVRALRRSRGARTRRAARASRGTRCGGSAALGQHARARRVLPRYARGVESHRSLISHRITAVIAHIKFFALKPSLLNARPRDRGRCGREPRDRGGGGASVRVESRGGARATPARGPRPAERSISSVRERWVTPRLHSARLVTQVVVHWQCSSKAGRMLSFLLSPVDLANGDQAHLNAVKVSTEA